MQNYTVKFGVAEVAKCFQVEKNVVQSWSYHFSEYLESKAKPAKGIPREFTVKDMRVFAYVFSYWEENPDIECIKIGLNQQDHFDKRFDNVLTEVTPLFHDLPEDFDPEWKRGVMFCGMAEFADIFTLADSYKLAGDRLIEIALANGEELDLICPAIYNYRHATELYLKGSLGTFKPNHDLKALLEKFKELIKTDLKSELPTWFTNIILVFNDFDPAGTAFRYGGTITGDEIFIDFQHVKKLMGWLSKAFHKISKLKTETWMQSIRTSST